MNQKKKNNKQLDNDIYFHLSSNLPNQPNDLKKRNKNKSSASSSNKTNYKNHKNKLNLINKLNLVNGNNMENSYTISTNMSMKPINKKKKKFEIKSKNIQKEDKNKDVSLLFKKIIKNKTTFFINEEKNKKDNDKIILEYLYISSNNKKEKENENKKKNIEKPEDISDYINTNEDNNYKIFEKNTNEAIEEVEEAKESSELKQRSSDMPNNILKSISLKKNIKKFSIIFGNKIDYLKKKEQKNYLFNKCLNLDNNESSDKIKKMIFKIKNHYFSKDNSLNLTDFFSYNSFNSIGNKNLKYYKNIIHSYSNKSHNNIRENINLKKNNLSNSMKLKYLMNNSLKRKYLINTVIDCPKNKSFHKNNVSKLSNIKNKNIINSNEKGKNQIKNKIFSIFKKNDTKRKLNKSKNTSKTMRNIKMFDKEKKNIANINIGKHKIKKKFKINNKNNPFYQNQNLNIVKIKNNLSKKK